MYSVCRAEIRLQPRVAVMKLRVHTSAFVERFLFTCVIVGSDFELSLDFTPFRVLADRSYDLIVFLLGIFLKPCRV